jgi:hypothetical protein
MAQMRLVGGSQVVSRWRGVGKDQGDGKSNRRRHGGCGFLEGESLRQGNGGSWESLVY